MTSVAIAIGAIAILLVVFAALVSCPLGCWQWLSFGSPFHAVSAVDCTIAIRMVAGLHFEDFLVVALEELVR